MRVTDVNYAFVNTTLLSINYSKLSPLPRPSQSLLRPHALYMSTVDIKDLRLPHHCTFHNIPASCNNSIVVVVVVVVDDVDACRYSAIEL